MIPTLPMRGSPARARAPCARVLVLLFVLAASIASGCARNQLYRQEAYVFGTRVEVVIFGGEAGQANDALAAVLREFDRLHREYHAWEPSQLTALNEAIARGEGPVEVSAELAVILADAKRIAALGEQLFNPAMGRLIALWGFHGDSFRALLPAPDAVEALVARAPSMADLAIDGHRVSSRNALLQLDLGGYLKGYALDRAAAILRAQGIANALINIGGNVMALGSKGDQPWRIGIQHPRDAGPLASMPLYAGEAVGTSGDYQRYFEIDGRRYSHLLDPRSGYPATATQSLTVLVTPREAAGTLSDSASKPLFIAADDWPRFARKYGIEHVLRVAQDGRIEVSRALERRLKYHGDARAARIAD